MVVEFLSAAPLLRLFAALSTFFVPLLACYVQAWRGTTPGKTLFQIRIADRHGLRLSKPKLMARMAAQMLPIWSVALNKVCLAVRAEPVGQLFAAVVFLAVIADAGFAILHPRRRSLHDQFLGTRVVLDAKSAAPGTAQAS